MSVSITAAKNGNGSGEARSNLTRVPGRVSDDFSVLA